MKTALIAALIAGCFAATSFAADTTTGMKGQGLSIDQKKAEITQHIQERIANSQAELTCIQAAQTDDALRTCKEKYRPKPREERRERREQSM